MEMIAARELKDAELMAALSRVARKSHAVEAELIELIGEADERRLYAEAGFGSMFSFAVARLGFSEDAACYRISVARVARELPALTAAIREGRLHLAGARLLAPHLTAANADALLAKAAGKSKREIEEIVVALAPKPPVPTVIRPIGAVSASLVATQSPLATTEGAVAASSGETILESPAAARRAPHASVAPLAPDLYAITFSAPGSFKRKLNEAQDLLRHRVPDGDVPTVLEAALDALIEKTKKDRFALVAKPRTSAEEASGPATSRHIPDAIRRAVWERDGGRCTFVAPDGTRCQETSCLEFDHEEGFAETGVHDVARIRLMCRAHNQLLAERRYGREWMKGTRERAAQEREAAARAANDAPREADGQRVRAAADGNAIREDGDANPARIAGERMPAARPGASPLPAEGVATRCAGASLLPAEGVATPCAGASLLPAEGVATTRPGASSLPAERMPAARVGEISSPAEGIPPPRPGVSSSHPLLL